MCNKQETIIEHIEALAMGEKISVRSIAKKLSVSDGTAYRAIKEAKDRGLVATINRVGTIRLKNQRTDELDWLNFGDVVKMVQGEVLGGSHGLKKSLRGFIIGAMKLESMKRFLVSGALMIVGNRSNIHRYAIEHNLAVLITGGFGTDMDIIGLAQERDIPIIRTHYDTFTVAKIINEAIYQHTVKKDLLRIDAFIQPLQEAGVLKNIDTLEAYQLLKKEVKKETYAVINKHRQVVGIVSPKDIYAHAKSHQIDKVMNKSVTIAILGESGIQVFHRMIENDLSELPVVDNLGRFIGMIAKDDLAKAIVSTMQENERVKQDSYAIEVSPDMVEPIGFVSYSSLTKILQEVVASFLQETFNLIKKMDINYLNTVVLGDELTAIPRILKKNRLEVIVEIQLVKLEKIMANAILTIKTTELRN